MLTTSCSFVVLVGLSWNVGTGLFFGGDEVLGRLVGVREGRLESLPSNVSGVLGSLCSLGSSLLDGSSSLGMSGGLLLGNDLLLLGMEGVESLHDGSVGERVLLVLVVGSHGSSSLSELGLNLVGVDDSGKVGAGHHGSVHVVATLLLGAEAVGSENGVQGSEGRLSEHEESSEVTTRGELEDVKSVDIAGVNTREVSGGSLDGVFVVVVDEERSLSDNVFGVSVFALSSSGMSVVSNLGEVISATKSVQGGEQRLGVGEGEGVNDEGELRNGVDEMSSGHHERSAGGSSEGSGDGMSSLGDVDLSVPPSPDLEGSEHTGTSAHVTESGLA